MTDEKKLRGPSDSIRVTARDLFLALRLFINGGDTTLENIRLRMCVVRGKSRAHETLASTARDLAFELQKLELVKGGPYPKTKSDYDRLKDNPMRLTAAGRLLVANFSKPAEVYDALFAKMFSAHRYIRDYARVLASDGHLVAPVLTSFKDHVAPEYASAAVLREEILAGQFRTESLLGLTESRLGSRIDDPCRSAIISALQEMLKQLKSGAVEEDPTTFAKSVLSRLNDIVIPVLFGAKGLGFDFRTHRALWSLGSEFRVWSSTNSHPLHQGTVIFGTATLQTSADGLALQKIGFDSSMTRLRDTFLSRLYQSWLDLQKLGRGTLVPALELRAAFCCEHRTHPATFNKLFEEQYARDDSAYEVHTEIQQQKPRHEEPLRAGDRNIGTVLVIKKRDL